MRDKEASNGGYLTSCIPYFFFDQLAPESPSEADAMRRA